MFVSRFTRWRRLPPWLCAMGLNVGALGASGDVHSNRVAAIVVNP